MVGANTDFSDRIVRQAVNVHRFEADIQQRALGLLKTLESDLVTSVLNMDVDGVSRETYKRARVEAMLEQTKETIRTGYTRLNATTTQSLFDLSKVQAQALKNINQVVFQGNVMTVVLTPQDLRSLVKELIVDGNPASEWWKRQAEGTRMNFSREMRLGIAQGETNADLVKRVRGSATGARQIIEIEGRKRVVPKFSGGIMDIPTRQAQALVRTATQAVSNDVLKETYKANGDVLSGMQLVATLDDRTCEECMGLDGGVWTTDTHEPTKDSVVQEPYPGDLPLHMQCRCVWVPITKSWKQLIEEAGGKVPRRLKETPQTTRASMDGQVPAKLTYDEWLRKQPVEVQKDVLGPSRWELWKDGKIENVRALTDQSGNVLTLKELEAKVE